jgi:hypothetical protein
MCWGYSVATFGLASVSVPNGARPGRPMLPTFDISTEEGLPMTTLADELSRQMKRVREEILPHYDAIPAGMFGAAMIRADLARAEKATAEGDTVEMIRVCQSLQETE